MVVTRLERQFHPLCTPVLLSASVHGDLPDETPSVSDAPEEGEPGDYLGLGTCASRSRYQSLTKLSGRVGTKRGGLKRRTSTWVLKPITICGSGRMCKGSEVVGRGVDDGRRFIILVGGGQNTFSGYSVSAFHNGRQSYRQNTNVLPCREIPVLCYYPTSHTRTYTNIQTHSHTLTNTHTPSHTDSLLRPFQKGVVSRRRVCNSGVYGLSLIDL